MNTTTKLLPLLATPLWFVCWVAMLLPSCDAPTTQPPKAVPAAHNRDAKGRFVLPDCPLCHAHPRRICTAYVCEHGHKYETPDYELDSDPAQKP